MCESSVWMFGRLREWGTILAPSCLSLKHLTVSSFVVLFCLPTRSFLFCPTLAMQFVCNTINECSSLVVSLDIHMYVAPHNVLE